MRNWRSATKKTCRVRAFILKNGGRRVSNLRTSQEANRPKEDVQQKKEVADPALVG